MAYTYAENIRSVLIADLSQFQEDDSGSNLGLGFSGWDSALRYARSNNLDCFGSVFLATGDDETPKAFGYGMWRWGYYVRLHVKFDVAADPTSDEDVATLAGNVLDSLSGSANAGTIAPGGFVKVVAANYLGTPENIEDVTYLMTEFLVTVKAQFERT